MPSASISLSSLLFSSSLVVKDLWLLLFKGTSLRLGASDITNGSGARSSTEFSKRRRGKRSSLVSLEITYLKNVIVDRWSELNITIVTTITIIRTPKHFIETLIFLA